MHVFPSILSDFFYRSLRSIRLLDVQLNEAWEFFVIAKCFLDPSIPIRDWHGLRRVFHPTVVEHAFADGLKAYFTVTSIDD